jgi:hypothetical protein
VLWRRGLALDRFGWRGLALIVICAGAPYVLLASHGLALATAAEAGVLVPGTIPLFVALISASRCASGSASSRAWGLV